MDLTIRPATPHDAEALAPLYNQAGDGLPLRLWSQRAAPGQDPWEVGRARIRGTEGGISHRNGWVATRHGRTAGCLFAYMQPDLAEPAPPDAPRMFVPLIELEALAAGTGYMNLIAVAPEFQGKGIGSRLIEHFEEHYRGPAGLSLIVSDSNTGAIRLYERHGFRVAATRAKVKESWDGPGETWLLMIRR